MHVRNPSGHIGEVKAFALPVAPAGYLECLGTSLLRADYPALFAYIGTTFGAVDGTHFSLPNLQGRTIVGVGQGPINARTLGETGGSENITATVDQASNVTQNVQPYVLTVADDLNMPPFLALHYFIYAGKD